MESAKSNEFFRLFYIYKELEIELLGIKSRHAFHYRNIGLPDNKLVINGNAIPLLSGYASFPDAVKDADFVIWSDHPLSTRAVCEQTWIDGIRYFSLEEDKKLKKRDKKLRRNLVNKILSRKDDKKKKEWKHHEEKSADHQHCLDKL